MIIDQKVSVKITKDNINHYANKGFNVKLKDILEINPYQLQRGSNIKIKVKCDICQKEKELKYQSYMNNIEKYNLYTCCECKWIKTRKTNMKRYGVDVPLKNQTIKEKLKQTNMEKYGCENVSGCEIIKEKKRKTNLKNWGVDNVFQSEIIKKSSKQTLLNRYGVEHPLQNQELLEKSKNTSFLNNGVDYPMQSNSIKNKSIDTCLNKYGKEYYTQTNDYKNQVNESNLNKYGREWYMGSDDFKQKSKEYYMNNFGVEYNMQNESIYMKAQINGQKAKIHENTGLFYRGSYEKDFLDFCFKNNINIKKGKRISYDYQNKTRYYFSDFYFPEKNIIIEIKSDYYFNKYKNMNLSKKEGTLKSGYNFLFIINKNYKEFESLL